MTHSAASVTKVDIGFASFVVGNNRPYVVGFDPEASDEITQQVAKGYNPAIWIINLLLRRFKPGARVLDLGSHIGCFSLPAAALGFQVAAFEASPRNAALLAAGIEKNGFRNINLIHAAVTDCSGDLNFFSNGPCGHVALGGATADTVEVRAIAIDDYLGDVGWKDIAFVKLDVEGSEIAAVRGMKRLLSSPDAPAVVFEANVTTLSRSGDTPARLMKEFADLGFCLYVILPGYFCELSPMLPPYDQKPKLIDCLAVKRPLSWLERHNLRNLPRRVLRRMGLRSLQQG